MDSVQLTVAEGYEVKVNTVYNVFHTVIIISILMIMKYTNDSNYNLIFIG